MNPRLSKYIRNAGWIVPLLVAVVFGHVEGVFAICLAVWCLVEASFATPRQLLVFGLICALYLVGSLFAEAGLSLVGFAAALLLMMIFNVRYEDVTPESLLDRYRAGWQGTPFRLKRSARRANARASERS